MKGRRIALFIVWILSLVAISVYGGAVSYGFFFFITLLPVISFLYLVCVYAGFGIYQEIESRNIVCRQPMPYYFVLQNEQWYAFASISTKLFSGLSYVEEMPQDVEYELLSKDRYTFRTRLICRYRGEYEVGVKEIIVTDFFRIFRLRYRVPGTIKAVVYPRVIRKEEIKSMGEVAAYLSRESHHDQSRQDMTVRDYMAGDAIKQIHFKASAREQKLKSRNRIGEEQQGVAIFYDTGRYSKDPYEYLPLENQIVELVLALGFFFVEKNMQFTVFHRQAELCQRRVDKTADYEGFYEETAQVIFDCSRRGREDWKQLAVMGSLHRSSAVIGILHEMDEEVLGIAEELVVFGLNVILYVVTRANIDEYMRRANSRLRIIAVPVDAELEEWL